MKRGALVVLLKAPRAGRVKTRLGADIGRGRAAVVFRRLTEITLKSAAASRAHVILAIDPRSDLYGWSRLWPRRFPRLAQAGGDLGRRLSVALAAARDVAGRGPVAAIGADAPALQPRHMDAAFDALGRADVVVGPAEDGGFWLIGFSPRLAARRRLEAVFAGVRWSGPDALADVLARLPADARLIRLGTLADIDAAADLAGADLSLSRGRAGALTARRAGRSIGRVAPVSGRNR
jgi:rSAM/selenodomain-associated transferase 1